MSCVKQARLLSTINTNKTNKSQIMNTKWPYRLQMPAASKLVACKQPEFVGVLLHELNRMIEAITCFK